MTAIDDLSTSRVMTSRSRRDHPEERRTARTVVVPLANPDTAVDLLRTAYLLAGSQERSRIVACVVLMDDRDTEAQRRLVGGLEELVETVSDRLAGTRVEFRTPSAPSVARGVLDTVRDTGADALVMGATAKDDARLELGPIAASILDAAPCDVFVLGRPADCTIAAVERVVVTVDDPVVARTAVRVGVQASQNLKTPLVVLHVAGADDHLVPSMQEAVASVAGTSSVDVTTVPQEDVDTALADRLRSSDLVVVGHRHGAQEQGWAEGSLTRRVLDARDVMLLTVARQRAPESSSEHLIRRAIAWMHPRLTDVEQDTVRESAAAASRVGLDYLLMMLLSGAIGALGLLLGSVPVIIGAMLVAPLMAPIQSFGIATVDGRPQIATRAAATVLAGSGLAVLISALIGGFAGAITEEVAARSAPTLLDAGVALAAGMAGAYATARKTIPAALAGVAIAAALVPPLSAAGIAAAMGAWDLALGATLLFTVNIVCIAVTTAAVFSWLGLEPDDRTARRHAGPRYLLGAVLVLGLAMAVGLALQAERPILDESALSAVVMEVSDGRAALVDAITDDTVEAGLTVRVLVELPTDGEATEVDRLAGQVREAVEREVADQLGEDVTVRVLPLRALIGG